MKKTTIARSMIFLGSFLLAVSADVAAEQEYMYRGRVLELGGDGVAAIEVQTVQKRAGWEAMPEKTVAKVSLRNLRYGNYAGEMKKGDDVMFAGFVGTEGSSVSYIEVFTVPPAAAGGLFTSIVTENGGVWTLFSPGPDEKYLRAPVAAVREYPVPRLGMKKNVRLKKITTFRPAGDELVIGPYKGRYAVLDEGNIARFFDLEKNPLATAEEAGEYVLLKEDTGRTARTIINTGKELDNLLASMDKTNRESSQYITGIPAWEDLPKDKVALREPAPVFGIKGRRAGDGFIVEALFYDDCLSDDALRKVTYEKYAVARNGGTALVETRDIAVARGPLLFR